MTLAPVSLLQQQALGAGPDLLWDNCTPHQEVPKWDPCIGMGLQIAMHQPAA